ncbi:MAG TPA: hypothetical protein VF993_06265 [Myxococcales bacterium]
MPILLAALLSAAALAPRDAEVIIVTGSADHMEQVMKRAGVKFALISPADLARVELRWQQILMVNCTGEMPPAAAERVRRFVNAGGMLYTTDHAVRYLIERIFPNTIRFSGTQSQEQIFPMQAEGDRGLVAKINDHGEPRWQLAGGGMLFDVVGANVEVLMRSRQVAERYHGSGVLGVRFRVGDGQVVHVTGHFFTQPGQRPEVAAAGRAFEQLSRNVVQEKKDDAPRIEQLYAASTGVEVTLRTSPGAGAPAVSSPLGASVHTEVAEKLRVLKREGSYLQVRDEQGNEGWIGADAVK